MPEQQRFSHITVSPGDDDEVVIRAGAVAATPRAREVPSPADDAEGKPLDIADPAKARSLERSDAPGAPAPDEGYHETTLEDLSERSPVAQRIVIAAAVVLIVCAIAYMVYGAVAA